MDNHSAELETAQTLVTQLAEAVGSVDKTDLSVLAKMHGWCEALVAECDPKGTAPQAAVVENVKTLAATLEGLILGEVEDATAALVSLQEQVEALARIELALAEDQPSASPATEMSDEEVAAKLDAVFEEAPAAETPPTPEPAPPVESMAVGQPSPATEPGYESEPLLIDQKEIEFIQAFSEEAKEHLEAIENALLEVERAPEDSAKIDDLFRPFHTIKGMAGFLNLRDINCLTHEVETLLDQGRKGKRQITPGMIDLVFEVIDILKVQISAVDAYLADPKDDPVPQPPVADMIGYLRDVVAGRVEPAARGGEAGSPTNKVGENLVEQGAVSERTVESAVEMQQSAKPEKKIGEILREADTVNAKQVSQALRPQAQAAKQGKPVVVGEQSVRIDTVKLDALVDMVGELVIAQTQVGANEKTTTDPRLTKDVSQVTKIVRDVQEVAMAMRMVPIGPTFHKMARLIRDVSRKAGKKVELTISGEETELDKNVIQQIGDPLVHMVRNAVDHGVEAPEARLAAGKSETGSIHLSAFHQGGNIVIEIRDDGKGLDAQKLIQKATEKGVIEPGKEMTDQEAYGLIWAPGFSMAEQVTDISGRGVGMDVVKRNLEQLHGKVDITSQMGRGTTFSIRLPLTLAIIDAMVVKVGTERFIIPTITIEQALRPKPEQITTVRQRGEMLNVRGTLIPLIPLGQVFGLTGRVNPCEAMVVIAQYDKQSVGIVVSELIGQQQVVIKSLGERFEGLQGIAGAAILGDGRVGLILETSGLVQAHEDPQWLRQAQSTLGGPCPDSAGEPEVGPLTDDVSLGDETDMAEMAPAIA